MQGGVGWVGAGCRQVQSCEVRLQKKTRNGPRAYGNTAVPLAGNTSLQASFLLNLQMSRVLRTPPPWNTQPAYETHPQAHPHDSLLRKQTNRVQSSLSLKLK